MTYTLWKIGELMSTFDRNEFLLGLGERPDEAVQISGDIEDIAEREADQTGVDGRTRVDVLEDGYEADECDHDNRECMKPEVEPLPG